ncbi:MAG: tandem-95 repeat protein, partial [Planctomycetota bacterium]
LSAGTDNGDGTWSLDPTDLSGLTITPPANSNADFQLDITATSTDSDGNPASTSETVNVIVTAVADAPTLSVSHASGDEDTAIPLSIRFALTDTDNSETLSILIGGVPEGATLSAGTDNGDGTWSLDPTDLSGLTITPPANSNADFQLTVTAITSDRDGDTDTVSSGLSGTMTATLDVTVHAVNDGPVGVVDQVTTMEGVPLITGNVLANDTDLEGDTLTVESYTQPEYGSIIYNEDGTFTYLPHPGYVGSDSFTYTLSDGHGGTDTVEVTIQVYPDRSEPLDTPEEEETDAESSDEAAAPDQGEVEEEGEETLYNPSDFAILDPGEDLQGYAQERVQAQEFIGTTKPLTEQPSFENRYEFDRELELDKTVSPAAETDFSHLEIRKFESANRFEDYFEDAGHTQALDSPEENPYDLNDGPDKLVVEESGVENDDGGSGRSGMAGFFTGLWSLFRAAGGFMKTKSDSSTGSGQEKGSKEH